MSRNVADIWLSLFFKEKPPSSEQKLINIQYCVCTLFAGSLNCHSVIQTFSTFDLRLFTCKNSQGETEYEAVLPDDPSPTELQSRVVPRSTLLSVCWIYLCKETGDLEKLQTFTQIKVWIKCFRLCQTFWEHDRVVSALLHHSLYTSRLVNHNIGQSFTPSTVGCSVTSAAGEDICQTCDLISIYTGTKIAMNECYDSKDINIYCAKIFFQCHCFKQFANARHFSWTHEKGARQETLCQRFT